VRFDSIETATVSEINRYIAEEVMFWHIKEEDLMDGRGEEEIFYRDIGGISTGIPVSWNPWQNIEHALWILERRLKPPVYNWSIQCWRKDQFVFALDDTNLGKPIIEKGEEIPALICVVALRNYGLWPKEGIEVIE
jgi:hypothetical protein